MKGRQHTNAFVIQFRMQLKLARNSFRDALSMWRRGRTATFHEIEELPQLLQKMLHDALNDEEDWIG